MFSTCYLCKKEFARLYNRVEPKNPETSACRDCYKQAKIQEYRIKEAAKPLEDQKICCVCGQYLTGYDDRTTDPDTGLRYHDYCKQQFELVYKYKPKTCYVCNAGE